MIDRFEHFITNITEIDLYWHRIAAAAMSEYSLKGNYAIYFTRLSNCKEGCTAAELTQTTGKDKADVSRDINLLIKKGLVKRTTVSGNAYRAKLSLTAEGEDLARKVKGKVAQAVSVVGFTAEDEERETFYKMLDEVTEKLRQLSESDFK